MITYFSIGLISPGFFVGDNFSLLVARVFNFFRGEDELAALVGEAAEFMLSNFFLD